MVANGNLMKKSANEKKQKGKTSKACFYGCCVFLYARLPVTPAAHADSKKGTKRKNTDHVTAPSGALAPCGEHKMSPFPLCARSSFLSLLAWRSCAALLFYKGKKTHADIWSCHVDG